MNYVGCYTWGNKTFRRMNAKVNSLRENLALAVENLKSEARVASVVGARVIRRTKLKQCAKARTHAVQTRWKRKSSDLRPIITRAVGRASARVSPRTLRFCSQLDWTCYCTSRRLKFFLAWRLRP